MAWDHIALCGSLLAAWILLMHRATSVRKGTTEETIVIALGTNAILHGAPVRSSTSFHHRVGAMSLLTLMTAKVAGSLVKIFLEGVPRFGAATAANPKACTPDRSASLGRIRLLHGPVPWDVTCGIAGISVGIFLIPQRATVSRTANSWRIRPVDALTPLVAALFYSLELTRVRAG